MALVARWVMPAWATLVALATTWVTWVALEMAELRGWVHHPAAEARPWRANLPRKMPKK